MEVKRKMFIGQLSILLFWAHIFNDHYNVFFFNSFLFYVDDLDNLDFSIGFLLQTIYAIYSSMQFSSKFLFCPDFIENKICKHFLNFTLAVALLIEQICMTSIWS